MRLIKVMLCQLLCILGVFANTDAGAFTPKPRILVGSPIRQKNTILREFLISLMELDKSSCQLDYYFIDDNIDGSSKQLLKQFSELDHTVYIKDMHADPYSGDQFVCNEVTHYWKDAIVWKVAGFKDEIIEFARKNSYDYLFLIDSDLVLHPKTLNQLMRASKDIVSNIFWTKWQPNQPELPQVWVSDTYNLFDEPITDRTTQDALIASQTRFLQKLKVPGTYEVGGLGACTLINKKALSYPISFKKIPNLTFWGEDRHFCIRATSYGLKLFVDTHLPAFHIYREQELGGVEDYKRSCQHLGEVQSPRITLSMIMKNEGDRYLKDVLLAAREYITDAVIIDDSSTDNSVEIAHEILKGIPHKIIQNPRSLFANEVNLRKLQWDETIKTNPDWILNLDADEIFELSFKDEIKNILKIKEVEAVAFRLYDLWDENHYRDDQYWCAHRYPRIFLFKYKPDTNYQWKEQAQHCGRFPYTVYNFKTFQSHLRLKHYGWAKHEDRLAKYKRYQDLDPDAKYGWKEQYESILDPNPHLIPWQE